MKKKVRFCFPEQIIYIPSQNNHRRILTCARMVKKAVPTRLTLAQRQKHLFLSRQAEIRGQGLFRCNLLFSQQRYQEAGMFYRNSFFKNGHYFLPSSLVYEAIYEEMFQDNYIFDLKSIQKHEPTTINQKMEEKNFKKHESNQKSQDQSI